MAKSGLGRARHPARWHEAQRIYDARCGRAGGLRVASTLRLPHLLHRSRFTNVAIGVSGVMARRDNAAPVNTPTCQALDGQRRLRYCS